jgi:hypothetical protein
MPERIASFADFWPVYLRAHSDPRCRALHYAASVTGLVALAALVATGDWRWLLGGIVASYAFAWVGHFFVEKNVPLTFRYPLWSFLADYRMFFRWLSGGLSDDLARACA